MFLRVRGAVRQAVCRLHVQASASRGSAWLAGKPTDPPPCPATPTPTKQVIKDKATGVSAGYGFAKFSDTASAQAALDKVNKTVLFGQVRTCPAPVLPCAAAVLQLAKECCG